MNAQDEVLTPEIISSVDIGVVGVDDGNAVVVDAAGYSYFVGKISSGGVANVIALNSFQGGASDGFIAKYSPFGDPVWMRFYGGSDNDYCTGVAVSQSGDIYVCGISSSANLESPTNSYHGADDVFCAALDAEGNLLWSNYVGGSANEASGDISLTSSGRIFLCGSTSSDSPINEPQNILDGFVAELDNNGNQVQYTFIAGTGADDVKDIYCLSDHQIAICGYSGSTGLFNGDFSGGGADGFIAVLDSAHNIIWSSYIGGASSDQMRSVSASPEGQILVSGSTSSGSITGMPGINNLSSSNIETLLAAYSSEGELIWAQGISGTGDDIPSEIKADLFGDFYLAINTNSSSDLPLLEPLQDFYAGGDEAHVSKWSGEGEMIWSSFFGGFGDDNVKAIATDRFGKIHLAMSTSSIDVANEPIEAQGAEDAVMLKISDCFNPDVVIHTEDSVVFCQGTGEALLVACGANNYRWFNGDTLITTSVDSTAHANVIGFNQLHCYAESQVIAIEVLPVPEVEIIADGPLEFCEFGTVGLTAVATFVEDVPLFLQWNDNAETIGDFIVTDTAGSFAVAAIAPNGCEGGASAEVIFNTPTQPVMAAASLNSCVSGSPVTLIGLPQGGFYDGIGVIDSTFYPQIAGGGQHSIVYSVIDENGCPGMSEPVFINVYFPPDVVLNTLDTVCFTDTQYVFMGIPAGGQYFGDGLTDSLFNPTDAGTGMQTLFYTYIDSNGCTSKDTSFVYVNPSPLCSSVVGVSEEVLNEFQFYPNPADQLLTIRRRVVDAYMVQLYDSRGALIYTDSARGTYYLDVSNYSVGMYYLLTMDAKGSHSFQLSVQH